MFLHEVNVEDSRFDMIKDVLDDRLLDEEEMETRKTSKDFEVTVVGVAARARRRRSIKKLRLPGVVMS